MDRADRRGREPALDGSDGTQDAAGPLPTRRVPPAILIVDDRPENLLAFEAILEPLAVPLARATTAEEALQWVDEHEVAVILLDAQMPGTDGLEAARLIKKRERGRVVPIIFITALDRDRRRVTAAYQAGAVDYLFKPVDPDELRAKVGAFLELDRLHEEDRDRRRRYADQLVYSSEERYRRAVADAEQARAALDAADRAKGEFLARMSHELRTPLNAILGYIQLLDLGILGAVTSEQHAHLNRVRQSAVHLLGLVNEILDLVTLDEAGANVTVTREVGRVGDAWEAALAVVRIEAAARNLTVQSPDDDGRSVAYVGDPHRVRQVLVHLLANAFKFTKPGGRVTVTYGTAGAIEADANADDGHQHAGAGAGPWAYLRVADTGIGIAADDLGRIFGAFAPLDGGHTRTEGGVGLGLSISRRLARAMGGEVTVRSRLGHGSAFTLWLPMPASHAEPSAATSAAREPRTWHPGLAELGSALASEAETVTRRHTARLRADGSLPSVRTLPEAQLRDHMSTLVGEIAYVLTVTGQTEGRAPELLRDGSEILRLVSEMHGAQRHRLGWSETHFAHELDLLHTEIVAALRRTTAGDGDALGQATALVQRLLEQSRQTSLRSFRIAERARIT